MKSICVGVKVLTDLGYCDIIHCVLVIDSMYFNVTITTTVSVRPSLSLKSYK